MQASDNIKGKVRYIIQQQIVAGVWYIIKLDSSSVVGISGLLKQVPSSPNINKKGISHEQFRCRPLNSTFLYFNLKKRSYALFQVQYSPSPNIR